MKRALKLCNLVPKGNRRFKEPLIQAAFDEYSATPKPRGTSALAHAYWNGVEGLRAPLRTSMAYGAYAAGVEVRKHDRS